MRSFDFFRKPVVVEQVDVAMTSDAGLLPIRQFDETIGLSEPFAAALADPRYQPSVTHLLVELSGSWPYLEHYRRTSEQVLAFSVPECDSS